MLTSETVGQCDTPAACAAELRHTGVSFDCLFGHFGVPSAKKNSAKHKDNRAVQHLTSGRSLVLTAARRGSLANRSGSLAVRDETGTAVRGVELPGYFVVVVKTVYKRDRLRIRHVFVFERAIRVQEWPRIKTENVTANDRAEVVDISRKRCAGRLRVLDHRERPIL